MRNAPTDPASPQPLYDTAALRRIEQQAAQRLAPGTLMQRAGISAAQWLADRFVTRPLRVLVLCGPGNNGGDGYACALALRAYGIVAICVAIAPSVTDDAKATAARWHAAGGVTLEDIPRDRPVHVIVDAMFGIGLTRPLAGRAADAAHWACAQTTRRVALDVPSGLDAERGVWIGGVEGFIADDTITFLCGKPGLHTGAGIDAAGDVHVDTLGVALPPSSLHLNAPGAFPTARRRRRADTHKGTYGNVAIVGGASGMRGAAVLAARAALRFGAGRVYLQSVAGSDDGFDPLHPEIMFRSPPADASAVAVVGCGLGEDAAAEQALRAAIARDTSVVLDADALNLLARTGLEAVSARAAVTVLTPHPLEAARLLGTRVDDVQSDRVAAARTLADRSGAWVVLKGAGTVIAAPHAATWINPTGGPVLATAGSGDVLAGMTGALLAQGIAAGEAVLAAVWLHGAAAREHGADIGLVAGEIPLLALRAWQRLRQP